MNTQESLDEFERQIHDIKGLKLNVNEWANQYMDKELQTKYIVALFLFVDHVFSAILNALSIHMAQLNNDHRAEVLYREWFNNEIEHIRKVSRGKK